MTPAPRPGKTVLLVGGDPARRTGLATLLRAAGHAVRVVRSGEEALAFIRLVARPDLVVLDLPVAGMDGRRFRERQRRDPALAPIPVLALGEGRGPGAVPDLPQLVSAEDLLAAVERLPALPTPEAPAAGDEAGVAGGVSLPRPLPQPGEQVRWRHPRLAFARGRFSAYGPGPFEVVAVVRGGPAAPLALLVRTEFGERAIDAVWLGPALPARREPGPG
jgi:CheY-like chemotaxis protein